MALRFKSIRTLEFTILIEINQKIEIVHLKSTKHVIWPSWKTDVPKSLSTLFNIQMKWWEKCRQNKEETKKLETKEQITNSVNEDVQNRDKSKKSQGQSEEKWRSRAKRSSSTKVITKNTKVSKEEKTSNKW